MSAPENFCLKWRQFYQNVGDSLSELLNDSDLCDVTLACDDDEQIEAHKVVLAACSPFFKNIFKKKNHSHPFVYLRGIQKEDLVSVVNFIYNGEVNIAQKDLERFLAVAGDLKLKGLTQRDELENVDDDRSFEKDQSNREVDLDKDLVGTSVNDDLEVVDNIENFTKIGEENEQELQTKQSIDNNAQEMIFKQGDVWKCKMCGKESKDKSNIKKHTEVHTGISYFCQSCGKSFSSKNSLHGHKWRAHRFE